MRLTQQQLVGIAQRLAWCITKPCRCGGKTCRIEPELRDLGAVGHVVSVMCCGCGHFELFSAAVLGLVPGAAEAADDSSN